MASRNDAVESTGPQNLNAKRIKPNLIFFIVGDGADVHNQDPRLPREYRDSDSPILHTFRGILHPLVRGKRSLQNRFSDFEALTASLAAARIFMGKRCTQTDTDTGRRGRKEGEKKGRRKPVVHALREITRDV